MPAITAAAPSTATYKQTNSGNTGHAEAVRVVYDPKVVRYDELLRIFFSVVADPTLKNRQGPDRGSQYRAALVPLGEEQRTVAAAYLKQMKASGKWNRPIVTESKATRSSTRPKIIIRISWSKTRATVTSCAGTSPRWRRCRRCIQLLQSVLHPQLIAPAGIAARVRRYMQAMAQTAAKHIHPHAEHSGQTLIDAARDALMSAGEQWTGMRGDVFAELARHERPASAYDIADNLSKSRGKRVAANSIYRILDLFVANNLAMRVESSNAYLANSHPGCEHDCIFLVCDECGEATHIDSDEVSGKVRAVASDSGFHTRRPIIEIRGLCGACA